MVAFGLSSGALSPVLALDVVALCAGGVVVMHRLFNRMPRRLLHKLTPFLRSAIVSDIKRVSQ
jgi:hypothetical protein